MVEQAKRFMEEWKQNIFVIQQLIRRDKNRSISMTFMGELWEMINPLVNMLVLVLVFTKLFSSGRTYPLYILTGTMICGLFTSGTTACLNALYGNKNFLIKTQLKKNIYVLEKILLAYRNFLNTMIIYAVTVAIYRITPGITWLLFIPDIFQLFVMMVGIGKILAVINISFADITYFYKIFTLTLMYGSAILYKVERMSPTVQVVMKINLICIAVTIARNTNMGKTFPDASMWIVLMVYAVGCYTVGTIFFNKQVDNIVAKL